MVQENTPDTFQNELPQQNDLNISIAGFGSPSLLDLAGKLKYDTSHIFPHAGELSFEEAPNGGSDASSGGPKKMDPFL